MDVITQLISTVGFPIACCIGMFWFIVTQNRHNMETISKLTEIVSNNNAIIEKNNDLLRQLITGLKGNNKGEV